MTKHYIDSLSPLKTGLFKEGARVIDVGCGAGFPSMPIKIARKDLHMTFLDSMGQRIEFLKAAGELLGLSGAEYLKLRAEEGGRREGLRESFDIAVSRAVSSLPVLCELCLPYVKPGGHFIALKGPDPKEEVESARNAIGTLGGRLSEITEVPLYSTGILHSLVVIEKISSCGGKYPRPFSRISKNPL
ncbi:Ribosomal RNA small subunit methyltransferase G [bioreactor metagenome]|uniref:Ribosomal RNA small subunit methyltransferase G n=1 Tax=bioreactor metagenome TaxID=1076179 RepID=A0A645FN47_9ZZZZ